MTIQELRNWARDTNNIEALETITRVVIRLVSSTPTIPDSEARGWLKAMHFAASMVAGLARQPDIMKHEDEKQWQAIVQNNGFLNKDEAQKLIETVTQEA